MKVSTKDTKIEFLKKYNFTTSLSKKKLPTKKNTSLNEYNTFINKVNIDKEGEIYIS